MIVNAILSTGNDEDIVAQSLKHNLRHVRNVLVIDNESADRTREIVRALQVEYPGRIGLVEASFRTPDELVVAQNFYRHRLRAESDYIFSLDADELIVARDLEELREIPADAVGEVEWRTYIPERLDHRDFAAEMKYRRDHEPAGCHKIVVPAATEGDTVLGNHYLHQETDRGLARAPAVRLGTIHLAHFPVRSLRQMNNKIAFMTRVFEGVDASQTFHLRKIPRLETLEQLVEKSLNYCERGNAVYQRVYDPVYGG